MCGINGFLDPTVSNKIGMEMIKNMANATSHRGPDNTSFLQFNDCYLAHNRLSIIDLSSDGNQPMQSKNLTIVFNGEIYNYKEIRLELQEKGYKFNTKSDTEVILVAYREWGDLCVLKFVGMWAFAIYNSDTKNLFCSRDRFGIKPFYYIHEGNMFYFSSEVKALKKTKIFSNDLNETQIRKAIQLGWIHDDERTMFEKVKQLGQATNLNFSNERIIKTKYWSVTDKKIKADNSENLVHLFKEQLLSSFKFHVRSDVPIAATLSGGIDSSSIVSGIIHQNILEKIETFTIYYDGKGDIDERPFAKSVIEKYKDQILPHFLNPNETDVAEHLNKITYQNDFPLLGSSPISQYFIMKEIAKFGIKVILSGQGADDYLGGYMHSYYRLYAQLISDYKFGKLINEANHHSKYQNLNFKQKVQICLKSSASLLFDETKLLETEFKYGLTNVFLDKEINIRGNLSSMNRFDQFHEALIKMSSLPNLLHYEDRNSMAFSIESRVPFLDHRIVELAFSLPLHYKIKNGYTKWILREAMKESLPEKIFLRKDKIGFVTPGEVKWLRNELKYLVDTNFNDIPNLNSNKAKKITKSFMDGDNSNNKLIWRLANMQKWIKEQ